MATLADLKLYTADTKVGATTLSLKPPSTIIATTNSIELIATKVIKYLLTARGTDNLHKEYGSYLTDYTNISESYLPIIKMELTQDLHNCILFTNQYEDRNYSDIFLSKIILLDLVYDRNTAPDKLVVKLEIIASDGSNVFLDATYKLT